MTLAIPPDAPLDHLAAAVMWLARQRIEVRIRRFDADEIARESAA